MKTKKILLACGIVLVAVGSALATSLLAPQTIYVRALITSGGPITCVNTFRSCNHFGGFPCIVELGVTIGGNITTNTYRGSSCTLPLENDSFNIRISPVSVYQLF